MKTATRTILILLLSIQPFICGCPSDEPVIVLELGQRGPRYTDGDQISMDHGTVLYARFREVWPGGGSESIRFDSLVRESAARVISGSEFVELLPDIDGEFWFIMGRAPGKAVVEINNDAEFTISVLPQPLEPEAGPVVEVIDAGADAAD